MHAKIALVTVDSEDLCVMREVLAAAGGALFLAGVFWREHFWREQYFLAGTVLVWGTLLVEGGESILLRNDAPLNAPRTCLRVRFTGVPRS